MMHQNQTFQFVALFALLIPFLGVVHPTKVKDDKGVMKFLNRFGYLSNKEMAKKDLKMFDSSVQSGLRIFQEYSGIQATGRPDSKTMEMMSNPRCGNKDYSIMKRMRQKASRQRQKRFVVHSSWNKNILTYQILNYPKCCINVSTVELEIAVAFKMWQAEIPRDTLLVQKRAIGDESKADIEIKFTTDPHEDNLDFGDMLDSAGRSTAHAFFPYQVNPNDPIRGDIHFNDKENWTSGSSEGQNFLQTATHEIGHALGLDHSMEKKAVMYPHLSYEKNFKLHSDDIQGIKALYANVGTGNEVPLSRIGQRQPDTPTSPKSTNPAKKNQNGNHKAVGWHCQHLVHRMGDTIMTAEQCFGNPEMEKGVRGAKNHRHLLELETPDLR